MSGRVRSVLSSIQRSCADLAVEWSHTGNDIHAFPDLARQCAETLDLSVFAETEALDEVLSQPELVTLQAPASFSDLYYVLFDNREFYVEVLNWWGSDINIHDHDFSGVQIQVAGNSLNVEYEFSEDEVVDGVSLGSMSITRAEIWPEGGISRVVPGMPHNVCHLTEPTVSILIRTHPDPRFGPQRNYFPPGVRATYPTHDVAWRKRAKQLRLLAGAQGSDFDEAFRRALATQDPVGNLFTLIKMVDLVFARHRVALLHEFADRDDLSAAIVNAAAYYRATEILAKTVKASPELTADQVLCAAALSASFDAESFDRISAAVVDAGRSDLWQTLDRLPGALPSREADYVERLVTMFGLGVGASVA